MASTSYSFMPGRTDFIASTCASAAMSAARLHDLDFRLRFNHAHLVEDGCRIDDGARRLKRFAICFTHRGELPDDLVIHLRRGVAEGVIEALAGRPLFPPAFRRIQRLETHRRRCNR